MKIKIIEPFHMGFNNANRGTVVEVTKRDKLTDGKMEYTVTKPSHLRGMGIVEEWIERGWAAIEPELEENVFF